jgi:hypothetical protein
VHTPCNNFFLATPSKSRFLLTFESSLFCQTCRTNQTLITNLLANYLPPADIGLLVNYHLTHIQDSNHTTTLACLPVYKASLEVHYPLVCCNCLLAVQEHLKQKEHFFWRMTGNKWSGAMSSSQLKLIHNQRRLGETTRDMVMESTWGSLCPEHCLDSHFLYGWLVNSFSLCLNN